MKKFTIVLVLAVIILAAFVVLSLQKPPEEKPEIDPAELKAIEDTVKTYYKAKPYEEGFLNKSEAEAVVIDQTITDDSAEVAVSLEWEEGVTGAVFILTLEKQEGKWVIVSERESLPD